MYLSIYLEEDSAGEEESHAFGLGQHIQQYRSASSTCQSSKLMAKRRWWHFREKVRKLQLLEKDCVVKC